MTLIFSVMLTGTTGVSFIVSLAEECDGEHETEGEVQQAPLNSQISREVN